MNVKFVLKPIPGLVHVPVFLDGLCMGSYDCVPGTVVTEGIVHCTTFKSYLTNPRYVFTLAQHSQTLWECHVQISKPVAK